MNYLKAIAILFFTHCFYSVGYAQPGKRDATFGDSGYATLPIQGYDESYGLLVQDDGKNIVIGRLGAGQNGEVAVMARFTVDGKLDSSFGTNGVVKYDTPDNDLFYSAARQSDGKIIVTGQSYGQNTTWFVRRYLINGLPDGTFNSNLGYFNIPVPDAGWYALRVLSDDRFVIAAENYLRNDSSMLIMRFNANGTPDATLGNGGLKYVFMGEPQRRKGIRDIKFLPSGKVLVTGFISRNIQSGEEVALLGRLNSDLNPDSSFNEVGFSSFYWKPSNAYGLTVQSDDKILMSGRIANSLIAGGGYDLMVSRFNSNGTMDTAFADSGIFTYPSGYTGDVRSTVVRPDGSIFYAGNIQQINGWYTNAVIGKILPDGSRDNSFMDTSIAIYNKGGLASRAITMVSNGFNKLLLSTDEIVNFDRQISLLKVVTHCADIQDRAVDYAGGKLVAAQKGVTYQWVNCTNGYSIIQGATSREFIPAATGSYSVILNHSGCIDTSDCVAYPATGIADMSEKRVAVYPNPVTDVLHIAAAFSPTQVKVFTTSSTPCMTVKMTDNRIDVSGLHQGLYYLLIEGKEGSHYIRFSKF